MQSPINLRFDDVHAFLTVRRTGSVTRASRELRVTPSQISKAIARLEQVLGVELLARSSRGVTLSDGGHRLAPELEEIARRIAGLTGPRENIERRLTVAAPSHLLDNLLPRIAEAHPNFKFRGLELPPSLLRAQLGSGIFDIALLMGAERLPPSWTSVAVGRVRRGLFARPALADELGPSPIAVARIREVRFVSPVYFVDGRFVAVDDDCPLNRRDRKLGHEAQTFALALEIACRVDQLVYGPALAAMPHVERGELVELDVEGWVDEGEDLHLATNADRVLVLEHRAIASVLSRALIGARRDRACLGES